MPAQRPGRWCPVPGTPRWAVVGAWLTVACVLPSSAWRTAVGVGVPLGWTAEHLRLERIPGYGTFYVLWLSAASIAAAGLTLALVYPWGEQVPARVPLIGGRRPPRRLVAVVSLAGSATVAAVGALSIVHWSDVSGFGDRPTSGWALLMAACYAPALLWSPLLLAVTLAYLRRHRGTHDATSRRP